MSGPRGFQPRGCVDWDGCEEAWPESLEVTLRGPECPAEALTLKGSQGKVLSWWGGGSLVLERSTGRSGCTSDYRKIVPESSPESTETAEGSGHHL